MKYVQVVSMTGEIYVFPLDGKFVVKAHGKSVMVAYDSVNYSILEFTSDADVFKALAAIDQALASLIRYDYARIDGPSMWNAITQTSTQSY